MTAAAGSIAGTAPVRDERILLRRHVDEDIVDDVHTLFDHAYYRRVSGLTSANRLEALEDYLERGWRKGLDPHPLFDTRYYLETNPQIGSARHHPLAHYLLQGAAGGADPNPFFDTAYYYSQSEALARQGANALVHYVEQSPLARSCKPNPLFSDGYYLNAYLELRGRGVSPLAHFLQRGRIEGRVASFVHAELLRAVSRSLSRGPWHLGSVLFFLRGSAGAEAALAARDVFAGEHELEARIVMIHRPAGVDPVELPVGAVVLEDHRSEELLRPSALRFLGLALASDAVLAAGDAPELLAGARKASVPAYLLVLDEETANPDLDDAVRSSTRVVFGSRELFRLVAGETGPYPANAAVRPFESAAPEAFVASIVELATRDGALPASSRVRRPRNEGTGRILVPCSDWAISGVNTALEGVGRELIERGWQLEIVFTRDRTHVEQSLGPGGHLPDLPHRWLARPHHGIEGMWKALIAEIQAEAPCIVFAGYAFHANCVVSALTNEVGAVMWVQADDWDYYEQAYRLGRYCNAIACVSNRIRDHVMSLHHPRIGVRTHVIHNSSIRESDILPRDHDGSEKLRIVYTGRLVQYQKRVLDFVALADELEALGLDFTIELIGTAPPHDKAAQLLPERAARHLERGTMRLSGRLQRAAVLERLRASDLFVLLSDFEGLPLSLVEAMAAGCVPVVAEMESGIDEVLSPGRNGVIVQGRDYSHWARTIRDLWLDEGCAAAMATHAQETVRGSFTVERIGDQFDSLFRQVREEVASAYERPPALTWGPRRSPFGDVLPPPSMHRALPVAGLGSQN